MSITTPTSIPDNRVEEIKTKLASRSHNNLRFVLKMTENNRSAFITVTRTDGSIICKGGPFYHHSSVFAWVDGISRGFDFGQRDKEMVFAAEVLIVRSSGGLKVCEVSRVSFTQRAEMIEVGGPYSTIDMALSLVERRYRGKTIMLSLPDGVLESP